jgi:hypothetical protein
MLTRRKFTLGATAASVAAVAGVPAIRAAAPEIIPEATMDDMICWYPDFRILALERRYGKDWDKWPEHVWEEETS